MFNRPKNQFAEALRGSVGDRWTASDTLYDVADYVRHDRMHFVTGESLAKAVCEALRHTAPLGNEDPFEIFAAEFAKIRKAYR